MKKLSKGLFLILFSTILMNACDDIIGSNDDFDDNGVVKSIHGTILNWSLGDGYIVKLVVDTEAKDIFVAGTSSIDTLGKFNIQSLKDVPDNFLSELFHEYPDSLECDNPNAKFSINASFLYVYDKAGTKIGKLSYSGFDLLNLISGIIVYSSEGTKITGSITDEDKQIKVNLRFEKGWNLYYVVFTENSDSTLVVNFTSEHQDGMHWSFTNNKD